MSSWTVCKRIKATMNFSIYDLKLMAFMDSFPTSFPSIIHDFFSFHLHSPKHHFVPLIYSLFKNLQLFASLNDSSSTTWLLFQHPTIFSLKSVSPNRMFSNLKGVLIFLSPIQSSKMGKWSNLNLRRILHIIFEVSSSHAADTKTIESQSKRWICPTKLKWKWHLSAEDQQEKSYQ